MLCLFTYLIYRHPDTPNGPGSCLVAIGMYAVYIYLTRPSPHNDIHPVVPFFHNTSFWHVHTYDSIGAGTMIRSRAISVHSALGNYRRASAPARGGSWSASPYPAWLIDNQLNKAGTFVLTAVCCHWHVACSRQRM